jgi:hypothetical protein
MPRLILLLASLVCVGSAQAGEVFVTKDAQGNTIYTDRPESLPAQKLKVASQASAPAATPSANETTARADADRARADAARKAVESKQAKELTAADKAKRCVDARARYEQVMTAQRLYEQGATESDRRYLDDDEIDSARESTKKAMDEFCADQ